MLQPQDDSTNDFYRVPESKAQEQPNTSPSDDSLIAQICKGQEHALAVLYDRYSRSLFAIAIRITGDQSSAEEAIQDVFQSVWQSAGGFQPGGSVRAWLFGTTRHRAIDVIRARSFRGHMREVALDDMTSIAQTETPDEQLFTLLEVERVRRALSAIPTAQRQAIELAYYGGLSCTSIAKQLGQSFGTVKTRIRQGLLKLHELLQNVEV